MSDELRPCPWCGEKPESFERNCGFRGNKTSGFSEGTMIEELKCLVHGTSCLRCGVAANFEEDLLRKESAKWKALAGELAEAVEATDIYFKALCEKWAANDGRVVSESGVVIAGSKDVERLCEIAGEKIGEANIKAREMGL